LGLLKSGPLFYLMKCIFLFDMNLAACNKDGAEAVLPPPDWRMKMQNVFYVYQDQYGFRIDVLTNRGNAAEREFARMSPIFNTQMGAYAYIAEHMK